MTLHDPLDTFRQGPEGELDDQIAERGEQLTELWARGGEPIAQTDAAVWLVSDETTWRIPRDDLRLVGATRSTDISQLRWGLAFYLGALPLALFGQLILALAAALVGGGLVMRGYLQRAVVLIVEDDRVPPFVVPHKKWRQVKASLDDWRT